MFVGPIKCIPKDVFLSMSDKTKLKMMTNQLFFVIEEDDDHDYQNVFTWLCENSSSPFYVEKELVKDKKRVKGWVYFYEETDLVAFKLRWM